MSSRSRWVLVTIGVVLLLGTPLVWWASQPATQVGVVPTAVDAADDAAGPDGIDDAGADAPDDDGGSAEPTDTAPATDAADDPATASDPTQDAAADASDTEAAPATSGATFVPTARPAEPVSVSLPAIGVDTATVVSTGLDENRAVAIPDDVTEVGWYDRGPRPGEAGNAFMTSHVDSRTQGRGVLFDLVRSQPGDPVIVTHADGTTSEWVVVARERIDKGAYPMDRVFRFDGAPGLVIDTCGGDFDPSTGSYENIDIVYAEPAG